MIKYKVLVQCVEHTTKHIIPRVTQWPQYPGGYHYFQLVNADDPQDWAHGVKIISVNGHMIPDEQKVSIDVDLPSFKIRSNVTIEDFEVFYLDG